MDEFKPFAVFAETVAAGSMSAAARRLGMSPSAVSQTVRALEQQAGVTLLHRSTRKLTLTDAGERCYQHCRRLLEAARAAADSLAQARDAPTGELRVAAPVGFSAHMMALAPLLMQWPQLRLSLLIDDAMIDLIEARIDIAIRVGRVPDSQWVARPLGALEVALCAAPSYLERHGLPDAPPALAQHQLLAFTSEAKAAGPTTAAAQEPPMPTMTLQFHHPTMEPQRVDLAVRIASNNRSALQQMCEQGLGLARLALADVHAALARGTLVHVLPQWRLPSLPVIAITPQRDREPAKVREAVVSMQRYFAQLPGMVA
jgi:DNA-binding transcriptional LysR family regulator